MIVFKCKMCGGDVFPLKEDNSIGVCEACDSRMTLPSESDERRAEKFNRANHYRMNREFDRAKDIYEDILHEKPNSAEGYWGLLLCRFGIEYVEDPKTGRRLPTSHRTSIRSILEDPDYYQALKYATVTARLEYREEATEIDRIQKEALKIVTKEPPYDIFICYKEKEDYSQRRTKDSVIAQEIYTALVKESYKVFFSRITLEKKLGQQYEPIIYAALRSARVMLVVTTSREHCDAVWVKNEWSRYLEMREELPEQKNLILVYSDTDPDELPKQLNILQALNYANIGALQDLLYGINKLFENSASNSSGDSSNTANLIQPLLGRIRLFLEDHDFTNAQAYCNQILNHMPENADAYFYLAMCDLKISQPSEFSYRRIYLHTNKNFQKAIRFSSPKKKAEYLQYATIAWNSAEDFYRADLRKARQNISSVQREVVAAKSNCPALERRDEWRQQEKQAEQEENALCQQRENISKEVAQKKEQNKRLEPKYAPLWLAKVKPYTKWMYAIVGIVLALFAAEMIRELFTEEDLISWIFAEEQGGLWSFLWGFAILIILPSSIAIHILRKLLKMFTPDFKADLEIYQKNYIAIKEKEKPLPELEKRIKELRRVASDARGKRITYEQQYGPLIQEYEASQGRLTEATQALEKMKAEHKPIYDAAKELGICSGEETSDEMLEREERQTVVNHFKEFFK